MEAQTAAALPPDYGDNRVVDTYVDRGPAAYIAELIGTFSLVFFITMVVSLYITPAAAGQPQPFIDWSVIGLVHAFVLFMLIQTLAVISGAHFNPAVTIAMATIRQIRPPEALVYIVLQCAGGILGALLTKALISDEGSAIHYGAVGVSDRLSHGIFLGAVAEALGTFFLMWAIMGVAVNPAGLKDWAGLSIGFTLGLLVMIFGPLTGAGLNPARALGPALVGHQFDGIGHFVWPFVVAPVVGAVAAALLYTFVFTTEGKKGVEGLEPVG
ncbi:MAG: glycerol uptake facilitator protein [Thermoleophilaceae bacterium]|nr:glycerol uptake facilitator protein [Thermoleophilaceae bacterium]